MGLEVILVIKGQAVHVLIRISLHIDRNPVLRSRESRSLVINPRVLTSLESCLRCHHNPQMHAAKLHYLHWDQDLQEIHQRFVNVTHCSLSRQQTAATTRVGEQSEGVTMRFGRILLAASK
jgi:hypothetical protein